MTRERGEPVRKAQTVRSNLDKLARTPTGELRGVLVGLRNVAAGLHLLQTSIQALIDLAGLACARLGLETPRTSFEILSVSSPMAESFLLNLD